MHQIAQIHNEHKPGLTSGEKTFATFLVWIAVCVALTWCSFALFNKAQSNAIDKQKAYMECSLNTQSSRAAIACLDLLK